MDEDIGLNFTGGGYSNEIRQIVNCIEQNWDGSSFLGRVDQQEDILWSMGLYYGHPTRKAGDFSCISTVPVFTKEVQVGCYKGCCKRMGTSMKLQKSHRLSTVHK